MTNVRGLREVRFSSWVRVDLPLCENPIFLNSSRDIFRHVPGFLLLVLFIFSFLILSISYTKFRSHLIRLTLALKCLSHVSRFCPPLRKDEAELPISDSS